MVFGATVPSSSPSSKVGAGGGPKDDDLDRLVNLSLGGDISSKLSLTGGGKAPLKALGQPLSSSSAAMMGGLASSGGLAGGARPSVMLSQPQPSMGMMQQPQQPIQQQMQWGNMPAAGMGMAGFGATPQPMMMMQQQQQQQQRGGIMQQAQQPKAFNPADPFA
jgi:hypothetical protein